MDVKRCAGWLPVITRSFHNIGSQLLGRDCSHGRENRGRRNFNYNKLAGAVKTCKQGQMQKSLHHTAMHTGPRARWIDVRMHCTQTVGHQGDTWQSVLLTLLNCI